MSIQGAERTEFGEFEGGEFEGGELEGEFEGGGSRANSRAVDRG